VDGERVQPDARAGRQELCRAVVRERAEDEPREEFVGPQAGDRGGRGGAFGGDDQQAGAALDGELVDEGGGGVVQEVGVVDQQQAHGGEEFDGAMERDVLGEEVGEGGEGEVTGLGGAGHARVGDRPGVRLGACGGRSAVGACGCCRAAS